MMAMRSCSEGVGVAEDPRGAECAAADHHAGAAGLLHHGDGVFGFAHVAVSDDWNCAVDVIDDAGDAGVLDVAGELHFGGAAVDGDCDDADIGEHFGEVR